MTLEEFRKLRLKNPMAFHARLEQSGAFIEQEHSANESIGKRALAPFKNPDPYYAKHQAQIAAATLPKWGYWPSNSWSDEHYWFYQNHLRLVAYPVFFFALGGCWWIYHNIPFFVEKVAHKPGFVNEFVIKWAVMMPLFQELILWGERRKRARSRQKTVATDV